jgi:hypothetical protein
MLIPGEIARCCSAEASLPCAITSIRRAPVVAVQKDAKRYSFSQRFCSTNANFSRLWRGLEQTAFKFLKHVFSQRSIMRHTRKTIGALGMTKGLTRYCVATFWSSQIQLIPFGIKDFRYNLRTSMVFLASMRTVHEYIRAVLRHLTFEFHWQRPS